jgi:DNA polymerase III epsilon subunit-like protein
MIKLVFGDTETTGLDPRIHDVWDIATILREPGKADRESSWMVRPDLTYADPKALEIGGYWERTKHADAPGVHGQPDRWADPDETAAALAPILAGAVVVGSNPDFDRSMLTPWLGKHGQVWAAHYRTIDVVTLGAGVLTAQAKLPAALGDPHVAPFSSHKVSRAFGVEPNDYPRHTALGDARWVRDLWDAIQEVAF